MKRLLFALSAMALLSGCNDATPSSDQKMNAAQERMASEAVVNVGMPAIRNWQEKRMMKQILELRDQAISTTTYLVTLDAKLVKVCDSIGYGLPYATQFTSPQKRVSYQDRWALALPQADPNGLFSPASADGTWVLCKNPNGKDVMPLYIEPHIVVSPFPLQ